MYLGHVHNFIIIYMQSGWDVVWMNRGGGGVIGRPAKVFESGGGGGGGVFELVLEGGGAVLPECLALSVGCTTRITEMVRSFFGCSLCIYCIYDV